MASYFEFNGTAPSLRDGSIEVRADTPVRLCLTDGSAMSGRYSRTEATAAGWVGEATLKSPEGTLVEIRDEWHVISERGVQVDRSARVLRAGSADGLRLELRATALGARTFADWQLFVPGALYGRNDTDGDGREDYLGTYVQEYRDDRLPSLAVLGYLPSAGAAVALTRRNAPSADSAIDDDAILRRHFVQRTDVGSLGLAPAGDALELRASYPFAEQHSFCLNTAGDGWAGYLPNEPGRRIAVSYELQLGSAESLTGAIWDLTRHQLRTLGSRPAELGFTVEEALEHRLELTQRYYTEWPPTPSGETPAGYAVHFSPRAGRTLGALLEYGFSGAQTLLAYTAIEDAHRRDRPQVAERARKVIDFFVARAQLPNGFSHGIYDIERDAFAHWFTGILTPFQYATDEADAQRYLGEQMTEALLPVARELRQIEGNYTRTMCESVFPILLAYRTEAAHGHEHPSWLEAGIRFGGFLLRTQGADGSWNRAYDTQGRPITSPPSWFGATDVERKSGTIFPVEVLVALAEITGEERWTEAARRAGDFIAGTYVAPVVYVGGLNDTTHIKSVKTDSVGVMFAMRSLAMLFEHTDDDRYLEAAVDAARILASWVFLWNVPFPAGSLLSDARFESTGWAVCDVIAAGGYVDNEFLEFVGDLVQVATAAGDADLLQIAELVEIGMQGALSMPGRMLGYAHPGIQCEGLLTSYWLSDPDHTEFSGAVSKRKGDDNDTCNGLINGQAAYAVYQLLDRYGTVDFAELRSRTTEFNSAR